MQIPQFQIGGDIKTFSGVYRTKHVRLYLSAQKGYEFDYFCITYTCVTQIMSRSHVHV